MGSRKRIGAEGGSCVSGGAGVLLKVAGRGTKKREREPFERNAYTPACAAEIRGLFTSNI